MIKQMKTLKDLKNIKGKRVLLRADFNVPIKNNQVVNGFRIVKTLPTIKYLKKLGAKIIIISHLGDDGQESLLPVANFLKKFTKTFFIDKWDNKMINEKVAEMKNGDVLLLENLRKEKGEMEKSKTFAKYLANLGDYYVNEAFSVSHREHTSIVELPKLLPAYAGLNLEEEIEKLGQIFYEKKEPFLFILGGSKFQTKLPLLENFLKIANNVFIGGALANDFFKEKGFNIGESLISGNLSGIKKIVQNPKIILPIDVLVKNGSRKINKSLDSVGFNETIVDIGAESIKSLEKTILKVKMVLFNGPLGLYEEGFSKGTEKILRALTKSRARVIVGGGDTLALVTKLRMEKKFYFVSTGGGATIDFLVNKTLPGIEALK